MKKSGMGKRFLPLILTAAVTLYTREIPTFAETLRPENQPEISGENQPEISRENQPEISGENQPEMSEEGQPEVLEENQLDWSEDQPEASEPSAHNNTGLPADILEKCTVSGLNPDQATVNLFDYWQAAGSDPVNEVAHDYYIDNVDGTRTAVTTFDSGISNGHMLRFAYRDSKCDYCVGTDANGDSLGYFGAWNQYRQPYNGESVSAADTGTLYKGIVKNKLGADGFPELDLSGKNQADYGWYYDAVNQRYLAPTEESLAYLFSPNVTNPYKNTYRNVKGLFQLNAAGYYYYDSTENFASYDGAGSFVLYNSPGVARVAGNNSAGAEYCGQFFPFNSAADVFDSYTVDAEENYHLTYQGLQSAGQDAYMPVTDNEGNGYIKCYAPDLNHYLGMTLEVPFLQPVQGLLPNGTPMTFEFSGDDDVWVFIDDVLVADLGGLHDPYSLKIDFQTGNIYIQKVGQGDVWDHTLLGAFQDAYGGGSNPGGEAFRGAAFADNTVHTLKMFYLERGHMASNLSLKFNIQAPRYHQIRKVDEDGNALENAEFALYQAQTCTADAQGSILCTVSTGPASGSPYYVRQSNSTPLITFRTGTDGIADFIGKNGDNFGASGLHYYILRETRPPDGYRSPPVDIVLEYNPDTTMFTVANRWQTGAYASFTSYVNGRAGTAITYGEYTYNAGTGFDIQTNANSVPVPQDSQKNGLVLAVPMLQSRQDKSVWLPLYGSNTDGFHTVGVAGADRDSMGRALLEAALYQCRYDDGWYLEWNNTTAGLEGSLTGLPGRADRYQLVNSTGGDMRMVYIIIEPAALDRANIAGSTSAGRYQDLKRYVAAKGISAAVNDLYGSTGGAQPKDRNVNMLDTAQFMRVFRSLIYIPNELRELRVLKTDEDGTPLAGAQFGIFGSREEAQQGSNPIATQTTGEDGTLIFNLQTNAAGQICYLKEIRAPQGYHVNETVVPVVIGIYSVYADAGTQEDGVSVRAGVGRLYRTMVKYASNGDVNITLRDIMAIAQTQDSGNFALDGWEDMESDGEIQEKELHYGINKEKWMDYGLHDEDLETEGAAFFETKTGFLRTRVVQNAAALQDESGSGNWDDLGDIDLTSVFGLINVVVVEDRNAQDREDKGDDSEAPFAENEYADTGGEADDDPEKNGEKPVEVMMAPGSIDSPQTGDDSLTGWWAALCILSLTGICSTACNLAFAGRQEKRKALKKRRKKHVPKK